MLEGMFKKTYTRIEAGHKAAKKYGRSTRRNVEEVQ